MYSYKPTGIELRARPTQFGIVVADSCDPRQNLWTYSNTPAFDYNSPTFDFVNAIIRLCDPRDVL